MGKQVWVSIPIGFSSSLQLEKKGINADIGIEFQSLSGFQVRCNKEDLVLISREIRPVSIPIGFSSSLQLRILFIDISRNGRFQSLSGFQVRCNAMSVA